MLHGITTVPLHMYMATYSIFAANRGCAQRIYLGLTKNRGMYSELWPSRRTACSALETACHWCAMHLNSVLLNTNCMRSFFL